MVSKHHDHESSDEERIEKLVLLVVGAAKGITPVGQVSVLLHQVANSQQAPSSIKDFAKVLQAVLGGARKPNVSHLPEQLANAIYDAIDRIEAPLPEAEVADEAEGLELIELLERVGEACLGNTGLWQQLWNFTESLQAQESAPAEIRHLGQVLQRILAGERQRHVTDGLPPELAQPVHLLLDQLLDYQSSGPPDDQRGA